MNVPAMFEIVSPRDKDEFFIIRDVGYNTNCLSVTNDAENVVTRVVALKSYTPGQRLFYFDSDDNLDELKIKDGKFDGFAPGPRANVNS